MFGVRKACREFAEWCHETQRENDRLKAENAKLRALCADIYKGWRGVVFERWSYSSEDFRMYERIMRELGIKVSS